MNFGSLVSSGKHFLNVSDSKHHRCFHVIPAFLRKSSSYSLLSHSFFCCFFLPPLVRLLFFANLHGAIQRTKQVFLTVPTVLKVAFLPNS